MRLTILDAARRLVELNGEAALTLSAVASEAGIARATIYGYFAGKNQLLSQLSGEPPEPDLVMPMPAEPEAANELAGKTEVVTETPIEPESVTEVPVEPEAAPEAPDEIPPFAGAPDEAVPPQDEQRVETVVETARPAAAGDSTDYSEMMRRQAAALDGLAKRVMVPKTVLKEGTAAAISRLETRLHVVEQSVADVETRRSQDATNLGERLAAVTDPMQRFEGRLDALEKRQQMSLAELRLELYNLTTRVDGLGKAPPPDFKPPLVADFQAWTSPPAPESAEPEEIAEEPAPPAYLASARRAAIDAAQQPVAAEDAKPGKGWAYWRWLVAVVIIAAGGLGFALNLRTEDAMNASPATQLVSQVSHQPQKPSLTSLAKAGNAKAQLVLGLKLLNGAGVAMHIEKAAGWLERAANKGQPVAQEILGVLYQTGTGVAADMTKAVRWYETAAAAGNVKAMANLGKAYGGGWSGGTDFAKATQWFARAAAFGDVDSAFDLAILYERGEGVPASLREAYKWYAIAAASGDKEAASQASTVAARLAPADLKAALKAAVDFKPAPVKRVANDVPALGPNLAMN